MASPRFAIYFVPAPDTALYRFGASVLGYDCYTGASLARMHVGEITEADWATLTAEPRTYGFHATLKAPFSLLPSCTETQLVSAFQSFAALGRSLATITPVVQPLGDFVAVVADCPSTGLGALASDCTTIFDAFRAPMLPQERARRVAAGLQPSQIQNLDRWGYPYLFGDFRFHMTLTGRIETKRREMYAATLRAAFRRMHSDGDIPIDRLALVKQDFASGAFRVLSHVPLRISD